MGGEGLAWPDQGHHRLGLLWAFARFCHSWRLGDVREVVPGGRAVRSFLRGSVLYFNSATFPANKEKLVGGEEAMMRSAVSFPKPSCPPVLPT